MYRRARLSNNYDIYSGCFRQSKLKVTTRPLQSEIGQDELRSTNIIKGSLKGYARIAIQWEKWLDTKRCGYRGNKRSFCCEVRVGCHRRNDVEIIHWSTLDSVRLWLEQTLAMRAGSAKSR